MPDLNEQPDSGLLILQIHLDLAPAIDKAALRQLCELTVQSGFASRMSFVESDDDGPHIDAGFETFHAANLWNELQDTLFKNPIVGDDLCRCCLAVRTGKAGWDDCEILANY